MGKITKNLKNVSILNLKIKPISLFSSNKSANSKIPNTKLYNLFWELLEPWTIKHLNVLQLIPLI